MLLALFVTVVINYLDRTNIAIAAIDLTRSLGLSSVQMGLVFSAFAWSYSLCQIPGGILADRIAPRILYPVLLGLWSLVTMLQGLAGSVLLLLVCRVLIGAFEAPSYPINNRVVTSWFSTRERAGAIGFYTSGQFLGLAVLAPVLVAFQAHFGWRCLFYACGLLGLAWAGVWFAIYRDPQADTRVSRTELEALRASGAAVDWGGSRRKALLPSLKEIWSAFANRRMRGVYLGQFCIGTVSIFFLTWFPTYLVQARGIAFDKVGFMAGVPFLCALAGVLLSGAISDWLVRRGVGAGIARKGPVITGILLSCLILGALWAKSNDVALVLMSIAFFGNGMASITWIFVSLLAPRDQLGLVGGVFNLVGGLSAAVTPTVIGVLVRAQDFSGALIYVTAVTLIGLAAYTFWVGPLDERTESAKELD
ncbi:MFS transporter [Caulobacter sp. X]|uniref:MFS transporter n=1 Tax=Caulobacter sp. X TaxID=2048901 RepID=UPI000C153C83|nr:MFS transporter [Caulobacter sp. X]PIB95374.1 MFS transporter [Caulobacter sp. X]